MKKNRLALAALCVFLCCLFTLCTQAQYVATWALTPTPLKTVTVTGTQASSVSAASMVPGTDFENPGNHNNDGYRCQQSLGNWPTVPTDGLNIDFPLSPVTNTDLTITSITGEGKTSGSSNASRISFAYRQDGAGPWIPIGNFSDIPSGGSTTPFSQTGLTTKFYSGHTYVIRLYVYAAATGTSTSRNLRIRNVVINGTAITPAGTQPTVTTNNIAAITKYTATATGTLTKGTLNVVTSGVCWSATGTPTAAGNSTTNGPLVSGTITGNITGLSAGVTYKVRAYAISESRDTIYGNELSFTSLPPSIPALTTVAASNILSTKATSGGNISDSGGVSISAKGVCWVPASNPASPIITDAHTTDGKWFGNYASLLTGLTPGTTYKVRAYATNAQGTGYGNEITFTTAPPTPIITAVPTVIAFGDVVPGTSSQKTYLLSGSVLSPASGNITVTAPTGYQVSLSSGSGFASTINVPYTGSTLAATTIYVRFTPPQYGVYNGTITHSGGGATAINIDNVTVTGRGALSSADVSNMGTDFWVGYGFHSLMTGSNNQEMVLYISAQQDALVTVEIPSLGYTQNYNITANVALATNPLPKAGAQDARLNATGISDKGIHVYSASGVPVAVWAHIYASQSSGATMVLPTNTWGPEYTVLTTGGQTNSGVPHSFFYVIASDDNTIVDITPSADITATVSGTTALYPAGVPFSVTLNKGQVFNALGKLTSSSVGVDLTGTIVKSRDCKKIATFTGNGRVQLSVGGCSFTDGGSDNFLQQMFPKVAWGTKYLSAPFKDMEAGFYRVCVKDPTTQVKVNGSPITTSLINGFYYQIETDAPVAIETDKPVMVAQYCATHACSGTGIATSPNTGNYGDPEMIILSPTQQAIKDVAVYSATQFAIARNYINVVIKTGGVASFKLDGINMAAKFVPHPQAAGYSYASFTDADGVTGGVSHRLTSDSSFNAIAYGFTNNNNHESYGYNAGTKVTDLSRSLQITNPYGTPTTATACKDVPFTFKVALPYQPSEILSLTWDFGGNSNLSPNTNIVQNNPTSSGSSVVDGTTVYQYSLPGNYTFNASGIYTIKVLANVNTADGCPGSKEYNFAITVIDGITANFSVASNICPNVSTAFNSTSNGNGTTLVGWTWTLPTGGPVTTPNTNYTFTAAGSYNVKLQVVNDIGCFNETTKTVTVNTPPSANFTYNTPVCVNVNPQFVDASTPTGSIASWAWNFGDNTTATVASPTKTYATAGSYTVKLKVTGNNTCADSITKTITVLSVLAAPVVTPGAVTFNSATFSWTAVAGATGYEVSVNGGTYTAPSSGSTGTTHTVTGLQANQNVTITVRALGTAVCQQNTGSASAVTLLPSLEIFVPNTFTPNGDGKNDVLKAYGNNIQSMNFMIFNQWGEKVYETKDVNGSWDGTYKGKLQPVGVYVFVLNGTTTDGKTFNKKGSINLLR